jgi:23S rRNA (adenine2030-N6)-methyltransferase
MNYHHVYHAGNFADVLKHAVLTLVIGYLKHKPAPFRIIDTHAGTGSYDLTSLEALKTGEWIGGIGRLIAADLPAPCADILAPYLAIVRQENAEGGITRYPGSPVIARRLMRRDDRLVVNELNPEDHARLAACFAGDRQTKVLSLDGWTALKSLLPPVERRGVVLVDPPFEQPGELGRIVEGLSHALRRFANGTYLLWYPIKDLRAIRDFHDALRGLGLDKAIACELTVRALDDPQTLSGSGLVIVNPPYTLSEQLGVILPYFAELLAVADGAGSTVIDLTGSSGPSPSNRSKTRK